MTKLDACSGAGGSDPPGREGYVAVEGGSVWYRIMDSSDAIPLLVVHGGPGFAHDYLEVLEALSRERPVVFYDQLGCGRSGRPEDSDLWRVERFVAEIARIREGLGLKQVHLLGHSWGSMLIAEYLLTRPAGDEGVILASPYLSTARWIGDAAVYRAKLPKSTQAILHGHERSGFTNCPEYAAAALVYYKRHLCRLDPWPELLERSFAGLGAVVYQTMWGPSEFSATGTLRDHDLTPRLGELGSPVLFTCGRYDEATPETTRLYSNSVPGSEMAVFEQSSHMPHLEQTESYLQTVQDFLRRAETNSQQ